MDQVALLLKFSIFITP